MTKFIEYSIRSFSEDKKVDNCIQSKSEEDKKDYTFDQKKETMSFWPQIVIMD